VEVSKLDFMGLAGVCAPKRVHERNSIWKAQIGCRVSEMGDAMLSHALKEATFGRCEGGPKKILERKAGYLKLMRSFEI
jgi:hypothetical protein